MRTAFRRTAGALAAAVALASPGAEAATITAGDPSVGGVGYTWTVAIGGDDDGSMTGHVGARSWNEPANPPGLKGWTHTSNWAAITLAEPAQLTITIVRTAGVPNGTSVAGDQLYPAFTLFSGHELSGTDDHQYNNAGDTDWLDEISYLDHRANPGDGTVSATFSLAAGAYSLAIGSDPGDVAISGRHGYTARLLTAPVPEPGTALLVAVGAAGLALRRRGTR